MIGRNLPNERKLVSCDAVRLIRFYHYIHCVVVCCYHTLLTARRVQVILLDWRGTKTWLVTKVFVVWIIEKFNSEKELTEWTEHESKGALTRSLDSSGSGCERAHEKRKHVRNRKCMRLSPPPAPPKISQTHQPPFSFVRKIMGRNSPRIDAIATWT